jgi:RimJ/RimL family protein N-acetyltransferase
VDDAPQRPDDYLPPGIDAPDEVPGEVPGEVPDEVPGEARTASSPPPAASDDEPDPAKPQPGEWSRKVKLRDGSRVLLRQIRPQDRQRLVEGMRRLSPASRYLRFHSAVDHLSESQLDYLSKVDHVDHEAIVAIDLDRPDRPGVGVARYIRDVVDHHVAEAAITVADEYHGMGAGTILLGALAARARENGVRVFRSYVLDGNPGMLEVFDHLGARRELETSGLWRVDLDVPEDEVDVPRSPAGKAFMDAAREQRHLVSIVPPIWSRLKRRRSEPDADAPDGDGVESAGVESDGVESDATDGDPSEREFRELATDLDDWLDAREER